MNIFMRNVRYSKIKIIIRFEAINSLKLLDILLKYKKEIYFISSFDCPVKHTHPSICNVQANCAFDSRNFGVTYVHATDIRQLQREFIACLINLSFFFSVITIKESRGQS